MSKPERGERINLIGRAITGAERISRAQEFTAELAAPPLSIPVQVVKPPV
jgi:hypothetical protein